MSGTYTQCSDDALQPLRAADAREAAWCLARIVPARAADAGRYAADGLQTPFRKQNGFYVG